MRWSELLKPICARSVTFFDVPIGDTGVRRTHRLPKFPMASIAELCMANGSSSVGHLAKLLVYTLRAGDSAAASIEGGAQGTTTASQCIATFASLLEHYFHANTAGRCGRRVHVHARAPSIWSAPGRSRSCAGILQRQDLITDRILS